MRTPPQVTGCDRAGYMFARSAGPTGTKKLHRQMTYIEIYRKGAIESTRLARSCSPNYIISCGVWCVVCIFLLISNVSPFSLV